MLATSLPAAATTAAPPASRLLADYAHTRWNGLQGAPRDVLKFAQTQDGWLWMATQAGLYRFDGVAFERMDSVQGHHLLSSNVLGLLAASDGRFFVGYRFGGISLFAHGAMHNFGEAEGLPTGIVMSITEGPDGSVWAATGGGLAVLRQGAARFDRVGTESGLPPGIARQVLFSPSGRMWVSVIGGIYYRDPGQQRFTRSWPLLDLMGMAESPDGTLWGGDGVNRYYRVYAEAPRGRAAPVAELDGNGMFFDRSGAMWLLKSHGLELRRGDWRAAPGAGQQLTTDNGISGPLPQTYFEDREGTVWIGTSTGLDRLRRNRIHTLPVAAPFDHPAMAPLAGGGMLVGDGSQNQTLHATAQGSLTKIFGRPYSASYTTADGALWMADSTEIRRMEGNRAAWRIALPKRDATAQALVVDSEGRPWISLMRDGLHRLEGGAWQRNGGLAALPAQRDALAMTLAVDDGGNVWAGYLRNRIARIDRRDHVRLFTDADGLELGNVQALRPDGPRLWAGGEFGLALLDAGKVFHIAGKGGNAFRGISGIVRTGAGELWLHGADGAIRIAAADVARVLKDPSWQVPFERFDGLDGLLGSAEQVHPLPSLAQDSGGRLWFATVSDIATIDPAAIPRNGHAPPVQIRAVQSNGRNYPVLPGVVLPRGSSDLQLAFTALSLAMPERVRFRYRLQGVDRDWQDADGRRSAFYTNLPPGSYRFDVSAANEDGVWNNEGASVHITIPPLFTQTPWFVALLAMAGALLLWGMYVLRVRHLTARMHDRLQVRLRERARIARGLHDTLLQSVQSLIMFFDRQAQALPCDMQERKKIEQTLELADQLMIEGRDYIMELRSGDAPGDLVSVLTDYGSVLLHERLHTSVQGHPRALQPHVHSEVHAIAREALFNAARHAQAARVELALEYGPDCFTLHIQDNGCGLARDVARTHSRPGHFGLVGMRERATAIGAAFTVNSMPDQGTAIRLSLDARLAYVERRGAWLARFLPGRGRAGAAPCGIEE
ncbi:sensor histidine kinase [Pseudoduganella ginsengisoli]|nr:sensor histidine kinase [Pseudoduganella ginsengisoli]